MYDVIVIGTGIAGLSAALTLQMHRKELLWIGSGSFSEKIRKAERIHNYPGLSDVSGEEFSAALRKQVDAAGLQIKDDTVTGVYAMGDSFAVSTVGDMFESRSVILTTGVESVKSVENEEAFLGRGVSYCATCDGLLYKGKTIAVVCTAADKAHEAEYLASLAAKTYYVPMFKNAEPLAGETETIREMPVRIEGGKRVERLIFKSREIAVDGVFFLKTAVAPAVLVGGLKAENGHVAVKRDMSTNLPGLFAAGDCTGQPYQYAKAAGEGNVAAHSAVAYLRSRKAEGQPRG